MTVTIASRAEEIFLNDKEIQVLRQRILLLLLNLQKQNYTEFYTNCAWGVPLWSAELVLLMKKYFPELSLHLAIPHEDQVKRWSRTMQKRYFYVRKSADTVIYISLPDDRNSYSKTDKFMLDHSQLLLFYGKQGFLNYSPQYDSSFIENYALQKNISIQCI